MSFLAKFWNLRKQKIAAYNDMQKKFSAVTGAVYDGGESKVTCVKHTPVYSIGVGNNSVDVNVCFCDMFCENDYCPNLNCPMYQKNHEYIDAKKAYKLARTNQWNLVKDALKLKRR